MPGAGRFIDIDSKYLAILTDSGISVVDKSSDTTLQTIDLKGEALSHIAVDPSSKYIFVGTHSGRVLQYSFTSPLLLSRICSFTHTQKNSVKYFAFYKNLIACSSFCGEIIVADFISHHNKKIFLTTNNKVVALSFIDVKTLLCASKEGDLLIISLQKSKSQTIKRSFTDLQEIVVMKDKRYALILYNKKNIALIDLKKNQSINSTFFSYKEDIEHISLLGDHDLLLTLSNSQSIKIKLADTAKLHSYILHNSLDKAFELVDQNPLLASSQEYQELQNLYNTLHKEAFNALIEGKKALAWQLMEVFSRVPQKHKEIKLLFQAFEHYERFTILVEEQKYYIAYPMSEKFPPLQETDPYLQMQESWKRSFTQAQKLLHHNRKEDAKKIVEKFIHIDVKRKLIQLLMHRNKEFITFLQALQKSDFKQIDILCKKNKIFLTTPLLDTLKNRIEDTIIEIANLLENNDTSSAKKLLIQLHQSPFYKKEIQDLKERYTYNCELEEAYNRSDFIRCYETIDACEHLKHTRLGEMLEKHWGKLMLKCEAYALNGNIQGIKTTLAELLVLPSRREKIGNLLRVSFQSKITQLLKTKKFKSAENFIYSYLDIFGNDKEIYYIMNRFESLCNYTLAITHKQHTRCRDNWIDSTLIH